MVTDANGCTATTITTITELPGMTSNIISLTNTSCGICDGDATVSPSGGSAPYTYLWSDALSQTTAAATGLCAGNYDVTVSDAIGCSSTSSITIFDFGGLFSSISASTDVSCNGGNDGQATASATGGGPPYTYQWDPSAGGQTDSTATGLSAGTYTVTVSDTNGCLSSSIATINEPAAMILTMIIVDASCAICNDGAASVTVTGGIVPYSYQWSTSPVQTNEIVTGLLPGTYTVIITDSNSCSVSDSITISYPGGITDNSTTHFEIYPNPSAGGLLTFELDNTYFTKVELIDVLGKILIVKENFDSKFTLDLSGYSEGVYFVKLYSSSDGEAQVFIKKLVITK